MKKLVLIIPIIMLSIFIVGCKDKHKYNNVTITKIEYSHSGGFGTVKDTAARTVTFTSDGKVVLSNKFDSSTATFEISKEDFETLSKYIKERMYIFDEKPAEQKDVMDGSSSSIKVELDDGTIKEYGGYMIDKKEYKEMKNKIFEYVDDDLYDEYEKNIGKDTKSTNG